MMDNPMGMDDLQVDDLFGDDAGLSLMDGQSLPSRPPTKELRQRVDELRESGCCQYVLIFGSRFFQISYNSFCVRKHSFLVGFVSSFLDHGLLSTQVRGEQRLKRA